MASTDSNAGEAPVFGPNGAVMNSPHMTDDMRAKIEGGWDYAAEKKISYAGMFRLTPAATVISAFALGYMLGGGRSFPDIGTTGLLFFWLTPLAVAAFVDEYFRRRHRRRLARDGGRSHVTG